MSFALYVMTQKGHAVLEGILARLPAGAIRMVITARDPHIQNDFYEEIHATCQNAGVQIVDKNAAQAIRSDYALAISWRWMIRGIPNLIVLHDSLLPRYRGFAPLPSALINGEGEVGVSAIFATGDYDTGDIIGQRRLKVTYPIKIQQVIQGLIPLYVSVAGDVCSSLAAGIDLPRQKQDDSQATYSLWRDDLDYEIDWSWDAERVKRFIDAVSYPYLGARTQLNQEPVLILDAMPEGDVRIENRTPGKVIFMRDGQPTVVCGTGLIRITQITTLDGEPLLPLKHFRTRFGASRLRTD